MKKKNYEWIRKNLRKCHTNHWLLKLNQGTYITYFIPALRHCISCSDYENQGAVPFQIKIRENSVNSNANQCNFQKVVKRYCNKTASGCDNMKISYTSQFYFTFFRDRLCCSIFTMPQLSLFKKGNIKIINQFFPVEKKN